MKSLVHSSTSILQKVRTERVSHHIEGLINTLYKTPILNEEHFLNKTIEYFSNSTLGENAFKQTLVKGLYSRFSTKKENMIAILNQRKNISSKVSFDNPYEKTDIRFIPEANTGSCFADTTNSIKKVVLNSEKPTNSTIVVFKGNTYKDVTIGVNINNNCITLDRDIKAGNNMSKPFSGLLAEIPYCENGELYLVTNEGYPLERIQENRLSHLATLNKSHLDPDTKYQYETYFATIRHLNELDIDKFKKNILIQEELFKLITNKALNINPSFYYGVTVKDSLIVNLNFHNKLATHINDNIFNNVKEFQKFMKIAIRIYNEEVYSIAANIEKSKAFWMGTGFEHIATDLFKS